MSLRSRVTCSTNWASQALLINIFSTQPLKPWWSFIFLQIHLFLQWDVADRKAGYSSHEHNILCRDWWSHDDHFLDSFDAVYYTKVKKSSYVSISVLGHSETFAIFYWFTVFSNLYLITTNICFPYIKGSIWTHHYEAPIPKKSYRH